MKSMVLVTGGSGFVGGRLVRHLIANGWNVKALARTPRAATIVGNLGAIPVSGSLDEAATLAPAVAGCSAVFHAAAHFKLWGDEATFERANVQGTGHLVEAARAAGTRRFVQVGAAAVVMGDMEPMVGVDESFPLQQRAWAPYSASKARSESIVLSANRPGLFETVVVRPPMIWGAGMPTLGQMVDNVRAGRFRWVGDGSQRMSTAHVDNLCDAVLLAHAHGRGGEAYFVSDAVDGQLKQVISDLLRTRAVEPPSTSAPLPVAWTMARVMEWMWRRFGRAGEPPITRQMLRLIGMPFTLDITKAQRELGYRPKVTWQQGLLEMSR